MARTTLFVQCAGDTGWLNLDRVTRLFVSNDITKNRWELKASVTGPQQPFVIAVFSDQESANDAALTLLSRVSVATLRPNVKARA